MTDPYAVLGVQHGADETEIKAAYRRLMLQHHPDKGGDVEMAKQINVAYEMLTKRQPEPAPVMRRQTVVVWRVVVTPCGFSGTTTAGSNTYTAGFGAW